MTDKLKEQITEAVKAGAPAAPSVLGTIPFRRVGQASEVAELICWLLCDGSSYISGTVQSIDGGWAAL
jgi:NAD(P)-dependent dehydrogenase (short-subunit alcohol dehydrogenase family)